MRPLNLAQISMLPFLVLLLNFGCGTWVGNPKEDDDDDEEDQTTITSGGGGGNSQNGVLRPGEVLLQKVTLSSGAAFTSAPNLSAGAAGAALFGNDVAASGPIEMTIVKPDGKEVAYDRGGPTDSTLSYTADEAGEYTVLVKNNTSVSQTVNSMSAVGADTADTAKNANARTDAPYGKIVLKAVIAFARTCKRFANGGANTEEVKAAAEHYFAQPFVFLGQVGADSKVAPLASATIELKSGDKTLALKKVADFPADVLSDYELPKDPTLVRMFYQGYFGAAGEMYTTDTFLFGGDCANAVQFNLGKDVGLADVKLIVKDSSVTPAIDAAFPVRASESTSFSMYTAANEKLSDYTQCTIDRQTGEPKTYNGDASTCKTFSLANPPYIKLDYKLPSQMDNSGLTKASDPTRILYYGHAHPKSWYKALIADSAALSSGTKKDVALDSCFTVGGLIAVPISDTNTYMPLGEFNSSKDDVVNLARRTGSYTSLTDFYQGNIDASGEVERLTCIPGASSSCDAMKTLTVKVKSCSLKADSGISVTSIGDTFVYPSYFEMSGIIAD